MTRYLLASEADKIQDFIFRSSCLREVVGGSQLLSSFCRKVPGFLLPHYGGNPDEDIIVHDGGSFRILFDRKDQAEAFGEELAEVYSRAMGGSLTVAEPVEVNGDFGKASEKAEENLRQAKRWREDWQSNEQCPYSAFCASCGIGLAVAYRAYHEDEKPQYLCTSCLNKSAERATEGSGSFLKDFYREVVGETGLDQADWPGKKKRENLTEIDPLEDVADYDPRRYVSYLLADGNAMGEVFGMCQSPEQLRALSKGLGGVIRRALAVPTKTLKDKNPMDNRPYFIPVLPLIMAGDDLFTLIPAPWALDFARSFCQEYENKMTELFTNLGLSNKVSRPTISAAVVICKSKYPYTLAHETGEALLREVKRISKRRLLNNEQPCSAVNFEVVRGERLASDPSSKEVRLSLRPYWITDEYISGWGLSVQRLIDQRWGLHGLPNKRLAELQDLYDEASIPDSLDPDELTPWRTKLERLVRRIEHRNKDQGKMVRMAMELLGESEGNKTGYWYKVMRYPDVWYGHGLPDLLKTWDFALRLDKSRQEYEEE